MSLLCFGLLSKSWKKANFHTSYTARKSVPNRILKSAQYKTPSFISRPRIQAELKIAKKKIQAAAFISDFTVSLLLIFFDHNAIFCFISLKEVIEFWKGCVVLTCNFCALWGINNSKTTLCNLNGRFQVYLIELMNNSNIHGSFYKIYYQTVQNLAMFSHPKCVPCCGVFHNFASSIVQKKFDKCSLMPPLIPNSGKLHLFQLWSLLESDLQNSAKPRNSGKFLGYQGAHALLLCNVF